MGRVKKSTRKFESQHLKRVLDERRAKAKLKQQFQLREKKKRKRQRERGDESDDGERRESAKKQKPDGPQTFEDMSVEQFLEGGFEIPKMEKPRKTKPGKRKQAGEGNHTAPEAELDAGSTGNSDEELQKHKEELSALADKDPEFYKFLKENDPELLDFAAAEKGDLSEVDRLSESDSGGREKKKRKGKEAGETKGVTMEDVKKWEAALVESKSLRGLRQVVLAFRAAAHANDSDDGKEGSFKYSITDPDVYHELVLLALDRIPEVLNHHLPVKESTSGKVRISTDSKKYQTLTPLLKSHSSSLLHLLPLLVDAPTQKLLLNSTLSLIPYFLSFRKFVKAFLKAVVEIWSTNGTDEATRITAFLVVRRACVIGDEGMKEACFRALYAGLVKASRHTTTHTVPGINLMKNSAAEIVGLPGMEKAGYQAGFGYIRQLAVHLRNSITNNSKESYKTVYNWQYVHSLDFWSRALSMHCDGLKEAQAGKESTLRPLIYPLVQVTLGAIRLIPAAQYFPLRFFLIRSLLRLSHATGNYIPLAPLIYEVLSSAEIKKKPKPSTLKPLDFMTTIRAPKGYLGTRSYQDGLGEQVMELFSEFYVLWTKSVAFPELTIPTIVQLKKFIRKSKNAKLNGALHLLVNKLEQNSKYIEDKRSKVEFSPTNRAEVDAFLKETEWDTTPLGVYVTSQRKVREERRRLVEESQRDEKKRERKEREAYSDDKGVVDVSEGDDDEDEDEDEDSNDEYGSGGDDKDEDEDEGEGENEDGDEGDTDTDESQ